MCHICLFPEQLFFLYFFTEAKRLGSTVKAIKNEKEDTSKCPLKLTPTRLSTKTTLLIKMIFLTCFQTDTEKVKKKKNQIPNRIIVNLYSDSYLMAKTIQII